MANTFLGVARKRCATPLCDNPARWISIPECNQIGNNAPYRCVECCDVIWNGYLDWYGRHGTPEQIKAFGLVR